MLGALHLVRPPEPRHALRPEVPGEWPRYPGRAAPATRVSRRTEVAVIRDPWTVRRLWERWRQRSKR